MNRFRQALRERFALLKNENGFLATLAVVIMTTMMLGGLALLSLNQRNVGSLQRDRQTQTAFSVAEAALNSQIKVLSTSWPSSAFLQEPSSCTETATSTSCPAPAMLNADFADTLAAYDNATWTISVRDNVWTPKDNFQLADMNTVQCDPVDPSAPKTAPCTWDSNKDGILWVVAQAVLQDPTCVARQAASPSGPTGASNGCARKRTLLAQAQVNTTLISVPKNSISAGSFSTLNSGNKVIINEKGCTGKGANQVCLVETPAPVSVRCTPPPSNPTPPNPCTNYIPPKNQVSPDVVNTSVSFNGPLVSPEELDMLRSTAKANGTYFTTCPPTMTGAVVFVDLDPAAPFQTCTYHNGGTFNSATSPGAYIISNGAVDMNGSTYFYGLIYALNNEVPTIAPAPIINVHGGATVQGALLCEGDCNISVGDTANALIFDPVAFSSFQGMQNVVMAQNSFRDIPN